MCCRTGVDYVLQTILTMTVIDHGIGFGISKTNKWNVKLHLNESTAKMSRHRLTYRLARSHQFIITCPLAVENID